ncbi:MAG: ATP-binding protein [Acidobacteriia bacterium]|nr:ATP-binding protein [Terriglobia bacterium]
MKYLPRALASTVRRAARTFPAVLVTGARQSGKTTLLRHEFGGTHPYLSLERPDVRARALADPVGFLREHPAPLILDEIQYAPHLLSFIKDQIDEDRKPGRWLLTGSQSFPLMRGVSQTLAGRVAVLTLEPLSTEELHGNPRPPDLRGLLGRVFAEKAESIVPRRARMHDVDLVDWLLRGGYPEPRLHPEVDRQLWFGSYVQTYLERDIRDLRQVGDLDAFGRFLFLIATRTGNLLNLAELGREAGVSGPTAKQWLSVLEASQIVILVRPYHRNLGKRVRKSPKLYLIDTGLATFLLGLHSPEAVLQGPSAGALVETAVVSEWLKACRNRGEQPGLYYWRSSAGHEVDLVIEHDGKLFGLEVKATATPTPHHADGLARWLDLAGRSARGALACDVDRPLALRPGIRAVPWHLAWV